MTRLDVLRIFSFSSRLHGLTNRGMHELIAASLTSAVGKVNHAKKNGSGLAHMSMVLYCPRS